MKEKSQDKCHRCVSEFKAECSKIMDQGNKDGDQFRKYVQILIFTSWIISLVFSFKEKENYLCADLKFPGISFQTYRNWLLIDGLTSMFILILRYIDAICCCRSQTAINLIDFFIYLSGLFKFGWVILGIVLFLQLDFFQCSGVLLAFLGTYYLGFSTLILFAIKSILVSCREATINNFCQEQKDSRQTKKHPLEDCQVNNDFTQENQSEDRPGQKMMRESSNRKDGQEIKQMKTMEEGRQYFSEILQDQRHASFVVSKDTVHT